MSTATRYRYWRSHGLSASGALGYVREEERMRAVLARFGEWEFSGLHGAGTFAYADLEDGTVPLPYTLRARIGDDGPVDWGDIEPTEEEREHAMSYYVAVQVLDANGEERYHDGIGGVDVIDLPGYLQRDWEDAAAYALLYYLLDGAIDAAHKLARREYAGSRGELVYG